MTLRSIAVVLASVASSAGPALAATYTLTNIGAVAPVAGNPSNGSAINAAGQVAGYYTTGTGIDTAVNPFVYTAGVVTTFASAYAQPTSINAAGFVTLASGGLYRPGLGVTAVPAAVGASYVSSARQVNAAGLVVGTEYVTSASGSNSSHPYVYNSTTGVTSDLGNTAFDSGGRSFATGTGINTAGHVVGTTGYLAPGATFTNNTAFIATPATGGGYTFTNVGAALTASLGATYSGATGVNDNDAVVGTYQAPGYSGDAMFVYANGVATQIPDLNNGTVGYELGTPNAINANGVVVGTSTFSRDANFVRVDHAFVYQNGVTTDLNSLIPANSGFVLNSATGINAVGQITGFGTLNGVTTAFLLNPVPVVPEPAALAALGVSAVGLLRRRRA